MALANDSITITPGTGATVATHAAGGKEHQVIMLAGADGNLYGSAQEWFVNIPYQVHVAAANTVHWDLFNADATAIVRVLSIRQMPDITTTVTGVAFAWKLARTTAAGTGGTALTPWAPDLSQSALDGDITIRSKPTGGATEGAVLVNYAMHSDETNAGAIQAATSGGTEIVPAQLLAAHGGQGIVLRQNQGIRCVQITSSAAGNTGWLIGLSVE